MIEIPSTPWEAKLPRDIFPPIEAEWSKVKIPVEHTFTHFHLQLSVWKTKTAEKSLPDGGDYRWVHKENSSTKRLRPSCGRLSSRHWKTGPVCEKQVNSAAPSPHGLPAPP